MSPPDSSPLPLAGMRVLDLTRALSGPFCALILADLGADVIKVEPMSGGDMSRTWGPFDGDVSAYFLSCNRNKRSMGLNFRSAEGRALLRTMALQSDVVVENFTPGTLVEMGLDPEALRAEKPSLIVASISGFGAGGPLGARPGFDQIAQGYAGFMGITGTAEGGPTKVGVAIGDMASGLWLTIGILGAWAQRQKTGQGQTVETSLLAGLLGLLSVQGQRYLSLGEVPTRTGNHHPVIAPYGTFKTKDGEINIAAATQEQFLSVCTIIGAPELGRDPQFKDNAGRVAHRLELQRLIEAELVKKTRIEWSEALIAARVPAGPINSIGDALDEAQVAHIGLIETIDHPAVGALRQVGLPLKLGHHDGGWVRSAPPDFGQHTRAILREFGIDGADIQTLEDKGIVFQAAS